ncbi:DUF3833 family protein [Aureimonas sp. Leaf454]|uniref:DUF3833 family protein n=1 Tax=Aureimonas sp. Leaf454 TaxID=1736381 RepID=UPI000A6DA43C|nr:DUF3833 family protein [Aureimonas sp. Leaf454]
MLRSLLAALLLALSGCAAAPRPDAGGTFRPEAFFAGASVSRGEIRTAWFFREAFTADFEGRAARGALSLDERFRFTDGDRLQRWRLRAQADGRYTGTVETETGDGVLREPVAVSGYRTAKGLVFDYEGFAPGGGDTRLRFRHLMEMRPDGSVSNTVRISKLGVPIAGAQVVFSKPPARGD